MQAVLHQPERLALPRLFLIRENSMSPAQKKIAWPLIGSVSIIVTIILASIGAVHTIDSDITAKIGPVAADVATLKTKFDDSNIKGNFDRLTEQENKSNIEIAKLRSALEVLKTRQSKSTQDLIDKLLAAASEADS